MKNFLTKYVAEKRIGLEPMYMTVQTIILVAGDSDFVPAIISAKQDGVIVKLYYSTISYVHDSLMEVCDDRIEITKELLSKCQR